ncbi:MAG: endonuclease domain-containing protein [Deltaproteobacteria bacterium]|nr:endonuclease domain-containing protein [Deltaproteobacteria bacterium]
MILKGVRENLNIKKKLRSEMTHAESKLWFKLKTKQFKGLKFRRQHGIGPYIVDFYCPERKLVIEIDGDVHANEKQIVKDKIREDYLATLGVKILRYNNNDILKNINIVLEDLFRDAG